MSEEIPKITVKVDLPDNINDCKTVSDLQFYLIPYGKMDLEMVGNFRTWVIPHDEESSPHGMDKLVILPLVNNDDYKIAPVLEEQNSIIHNLKNENIILKNRIEELKTSIHFQDKELQRLLQQSKDKVFIDIDNERGCHNCKHNQGSICEIHDKGTHDYIKGASECGLKDWEIKEQRFTFNSTYARKFNILNISPNGIVTLGNGHKAQWRMKDVREIYNELPPFEDFNREIFQQIKNKFHTKFDDGVTGRIIYNIYNGTFEGII